MSTPGPMTSVPSLLSVLMTFRTGMAPRLPSCAGSVPAESPWHMRWHVRGRTGMIVTASATVICGCGKFRRPAEPIDGADV